MKTVFNNVQYLLLKRIPFYFILISCVVAGAIFMAFLPQKKKEKNLLQPVAVCESGISLIRSYDYALTRPLLIAETEDASVSLNNLNSSLKGLIEQEKQNGVIISAAVYFRKLNNGDWTSVNDGENFAPGSLIKVPVMITYFKMAEKDPSILKKKLRIKDGDKFPNQTYTDQGIDPTKEYTVEELLKFMIQRSDNAATLLLNSNVDIPLFQKLFTDVGMAMPNVQDLNFSITASQYSKFFRLLYNGSYISHEYSEKALEMLAGSTFNQGFTKFLQDDVTVAHKFGETAKDGIHQLHETGIFYLENKPYLLTVMTKGTDVGKLPGALADLSNFVYESMK